MLPVYVGVMLLVGTYSGEGPIPDALGKSVPWLVLNTTMLVLIGCALVQFLELPLRTTGGLSIFRLAVVDAKGKPAGVSRLLVRWAVTWLPLLVPLALVTLLTGWHTTIAAIITIGLLLPWLVAAGCAVAHPNRGPADRVASTWVVRR